jgi:hypothetical protein
MEGGYTLSCIDELLRMCEATMRKVSTPTAIVFGPSTAAPGRRR